MRSWLAFGVAAPFVWLAACSGTHPFAPGSSERDSSVGTSNDNGGSGATGFASSGSGGGRFINTNDGAVQVGSGPCKGGHYNGNFTGSYTSHLTAVGIPIPVTGNVDMTLDQQGGADQTCHPAGEIPVPCNEVFTLKNGTITGVADSVTVGDASEGGFPYFCTMTGTLDCASKRLDMGWIQCTYCVGPLADGGMACQFLNGVLGTTGVGGHFAGPLTADYDVAKLAFVMGTWNGAEALAGNDGTMPGPDGGPISDYLTDSGYVGFNYGGNGTWTAAYDGRDQ
jgi:hypothetical protein